MSLLTYRLGYGVYGTVDAIGAATLLGAKIDFTSTGDKIIIPGVTSQKIYVYQIFLITNAGTNLVFKDGSTALTGALAMSANGGLVLDFHNEPWFVTTADLDFILNQSGTAQVSGRIYYLQQ